MCTDCLQKLDNPLMEYFKKIVTTMDQAIAQKSQKVSSKTSTDSGKPLQSVEGEFMFVP